VKNTAKEVPKQSLGQKYRSQAQLGNEEHRLPACATKKRERVCLRL